MKKVIGIMPLYDDEKESYWMLPGYMKMLEAYRLLETMLFFGILLCFLSRIYPSNLQNKNI